MIDSEILFIVTSSIGAKHGVFDEDQRLSQTQGTIQSIRHHFPNANIIIIDNTGYYHFSDKLTFIDVSNLNINDRIQEFDNRYLRSGKFGMAKTEGEIKMMIEILSFIESDIKYVFKLSGRYQLSPAFDKSKIDYSKLFFKSSEPTWIEPGKRFDNIGYQYSSRLWGFPIHMVESIRNSFNGMLDILDNLLSSDMPYLQSYVDIEHLFYYFFNKLPHVEIPIIHVFGVLAPNGELIYD